MRKSLYTLGYFIVVIIIAIIAWRIITKHHGCTKCNIVVISIDPLRADNLPCLGYIYNTTPNICRFANRNINFTHAYAQSSWTLPSIMSMISSQYPYEHGMLIPYQSVLAPETITLPQSLKNAGYNTIFMGDTNNSHLPLDKGLGRGFSQIYEYKHDPKEMNDFLTQQKNLHQPFFMFIHNFDMSASWNGVTNPPDKFQFDPTFSPPQIYNPTTFTDVAWKDSIYFLEQKINLSANNTRILSLLKNATSTQQAYTYFKQLSALDQQTILSFSIFEHIDMNNPTHVRFLRNLYDERLSQLDQSLAPLLEMLSSPQWANDTIVVLVANHGDELGEHGRMSHGTNLFGSTTHIPLVIHIPHTPPQRIDTLVASIDIFPTIVDLIGVGIPKSIHGESLTAVINKLTSSLKRNHIVSQLGPFPWVSMIRTTSWSYYNDETDTPPEMLFDLTTDPAEQINILHKYPEIQKRLNEQLMQINRANNSIEAIKSKTNKP